MAKLEESRVSLKHAVKNVTNKQIKGKIPAKRITPRIEHIKHAKSRVAS